MIVGRADQLATLDQALGAAEGGRSVSVLVEGDAGMGTTTLLEWTRREARHRGFVTAAASAAYGEDDVPFALVHDVLTSLLSSGRDGGRAVQEWRVTLVEPPAPTPTSMSTALHRRLVEASRDAPVLLTVDDVQWADESSRSVLALVASRLVDERVALVVGTRPPADDRFGSWSVVDCPPLSRDDAITLLTHVAGSPVDPVVADAVTAAWGGCPHAITECRRLLSPRQLAGREPLPDPMPVADQLRAAWLPTVRAMSVSARRAVTALCVLDSSRPELVSRVLSDVGCTLGDLDEARHGGLVTVGHDGVPTIASPVVRATVLDDAPESTIRALHRQVADVARRVQAPVAVVVAHLSQSGRPGDDDVAGALEEQARRALARDQPEVAAAAYTRAAQLVADDPERERDLAVTAARVWLTQTTTPRGSAALLATLTSLDLTPADRVWRDWLRAEVLSDDDLHQAACAAMAAAAHARDSHPDLVTWLLWDVVATAWTADDPQLALEAARQLDGWYRSGRSRTDPEPGWLPETLLGAALLEAGDSDAGARLLRQARRRSAPWQPTSRTPLATLINVVALDELMMADDLPRDVRLEELMLRLGEDRDATLAATIVLTAWNAARRSDLRTASRQARAAYDLARAVRAAPEEISSLCLLVQVQAHTDPSSGAEPEIGQLRRLARRVGHHRALAEADRAVGLGALANGRVDDAITSLEPVDAARLHGRSSSDSLLAGRVDLVEAYVQAHRGTEAAQSARTVLRSLDALAPDDAGAAGLRDRTTALLLDDDDAQALYASAEDAFAQAHDSVQQARTHLQHARYLRRHHRPTAARDQAGRAVHLLDLVGAAAWTEAARAERSCGEHTAAMSGHSLDRLTPQERRVAEAVSDGASTREAAEALVLSPRTVEFHLGNVYRKLGVHNRAQLANALTDTPAQHPAGTR